MSERIAAAEALAKSAGRELIGDPYVFAVDLIGSEPWDPDTITQFFARLRTRLGLDHLEFKGLRKFMDTYGQELGFSTAQVAIRAGHDPAVAARHYTGRVDPTDRKLADSIGRLIGAADQSSPEVGWEVSGVPPGFSSDPEADSEAS